VYAWRGARGLAYTATLNPPRVGDWKLFGRLAVDPRWFSERVGGLSLWEFWHQAVPAIKAGSKISSLVDEALIVAIIKQESGLNKRAIGAKTYLETPEGESGARAKGAAQFMWQTAKAVGMTNRFDLRQSIIGQAKLLAQNIKRYQGRKYLGAAAYFGGPKAITKTANGFYAVKANYPKTQVYACEVMLKRAKILRDQKMIELWTRELAAIRADIKGRY
jgi:soluble lytic murein transglycosylase-like protein